MGEVGEIPQNLVFGHVGREVVQHVVDRQSHAADAWFAADFPRLDGDDLPVVHGFHASRDLRELCFGENHVQFARDFLSCASAGVIAAAASCSKPTPTPATAAPPPGAPPAFGTSPDVGPPVSPATFAEAEKLVQFPLSPEERQVAAGNWRSSMAPLYERRIGPRKFAPPPSLAPATRWDPVLPGLLGTPQAGPARDRFLRSAAAPDPLPASEQDIAFAPLSRLSRWIETRQLTSERITRLYLDRLQRFDPKLRCVITPTRDLALTQAQQADSEIAAGHYRGPLHGIPWGAKDLLDTAGIPTTYGAEPYRNRVPAEDAAVVKRLHEAGAVLVAKLSLGALALNDIWFGGQTMNPWLLEEGSSGSSAGPGAATAAGLVGFAIGSETGGSIVGPSMRCGVTGLRPTYGRVPRTGAMTLCWSLDKLGPMTRGVEDALLVLQAISGPDPGDAASVPSRLDFDAAAPVAGLRVGYIPAWMKEDPATDVDRAALETTRKLGMVPVEVSLPDWPYDSLDLILFAEGAAAFEELTLAGGLKELKAQVPDAWPNLFRQARFLSAVDFVQADRFRRGVAQEMARIFSHLDVLLVPSLRDEILTITNFTGHPSLTLRAGFVEVSEARSDWAPDAAHPLPKFSPPRRVPHGVTFIGRLFDEGVLGRAGLAMERAMNVAGERPPGF
jgi:Asp-tRNA(Asn)/Glu-tRNA(Gln) amidotransferase A subunit family amidase